MTLRKTFFNVTVVLALIFGCQPKIHQESPNIVFIITDDQQVGLLTSEGNTVIQTPNIDRIAKEGMTFSNFFVTTPLCSPSRATFLTGQYPHTHGIVNNDRVGLDVISHTLMTWPRQLRENGYKTAFIGKWHMGLDDSRRPGFDRWLSFKGQGVFVDGVVNDDGIDRQTSGYMTDILNNAAVEFLGQMDENQPFAMILSHKALHMPLIPAERHEHKFLEYQFEMPVHVEEDLAVKPMITRKVPWKGMFGYDNAVPEPPEPRRGRGFDLQSIARDQLRCLRSVDEGVGAIINELEKKQMLDNTVLIYTSDNGMLVGEHGAFHDKRWAYDPSIKVPFLIRYPKMISSGSASEELVLNLDFAPTIFELAKIEPHLKMEGRSFVPLLNSNSSTWRELFMAEYHFEQVVPKVPAWKCVRSREWKYIRYLNQPEEMNELYHLADDPEELHNLHNVVDYKNQLAVMQHKLDSLSQL